MISSGTPDCRPTAEQLADDHPQNPVGSHYEHLRAIMNMLEPPVAVVQGPFSWIRNASRSRTKIDATSQVSLQVYSSLVPARGACAPRRRAPPRATRLTRPASGRSGRLIQVFLLNRHFQGTGVQGHREQRLGHRVTQLASQPVALQPSRSSSTPALRPAAPGPTAHSRHSLTPGWGAHREKQSPRGPGTLPRISPKSVPWRACSEPAARACISAGLCASLRRDSGYAS
jgi:hypothetical protein